MWAYPSDETLDKPRPNPQPFVSTQITAAKSFIRLAPGRRDEAGAAEKIGGRIWTDYPRSGGEARQAGGAVVVLDGWAGKNLIKRSSSFIIISGLYYKCFTILIYDHYDSGQYYKTTITIIIDDPS